MLLFLLFLLQISEFFLIYLAIHAWLAFDFKWSELTFSFFNIAVLLKVLDLELMSVCLMVLLCCLTTTTLCPRLCAVSVLSLNSKHTLFWNKNNLFSNISQCHMGILSLSDLHSLYTVFIQHFIVKYGWSDYPFNSDGSGSMVCFHAVYFIFC